MTFFPIQKAFGKTLPSEYILALSLHPTFFFFNRSRKTQNLLLGGDLLEDTTTAICIFLYWVHPHSGNTYSA